MSHSPCAATSPATIEVADDPRPRPWGTALRQLSCRPAGAWTASCSQAASIDRQTRCRSSRGTSAAPSPSTSTLRPGCEVTVATYSSQMPSASPTESNPGPMLALLPGTRTRTDDPLTLSLIHISEPTRLGMTSYAVFCLKKKKKQAG